MTQEQPQGPRVEEHPETYRVIEKTPREWWRELEAAMQPKEVELK